MIIYKHIFIFFFLISFRRRICCELEKRIESFDIIIVISIILRLTIVTGRFSLKNE